MALYHGSGWVYLATCGLLTTLALVSASDSTNGELADYCENDVFKASCGEDEVVQIHYARYGRMRSDGRCITSDYGKIGCQSDVIGYLDQRCSGRQSCQAVVSTLVPDDDQPCPKDFRSYLQANYSCVKVTNGGASLCRANNHVRVTEKSGYLSSHVTQESKLGSLDCPWLIEVKPGQTLTMSILDFSWKGINRAQKGDTVCHVYAIIKETASSRSETICAGYLREKQIYTSETNIVEVRLVVNRQDNLGHFLLRYQALGCGDIEPPKYGWYDRRSDNLAIVGCDQSEDKWSLKCVGNDWQGQRGNCSGGDAVIGTSGGSAFSGFGFSSGLSILVIILIAVAIGVVILLIGLLVLRRQFQRRPAPPQRTPDVYDAYTAQSRDGNLSTRLSKSAEILDPYQGENTYSRTWQMHSHNYPDGNYNEADIKAYNGRYVEHVYESPKFDRKEYPTDTMVGTGAPPSVQYYELEAEQQPPSGGPIQVIDEHRVPSRNPLIPGYGMNRNSNMS